MRKLLILIFILFVAVSSISSQDLFTERHPNSRYMEINNTKAEFLKLSNTEIDTLSVWSLLPKMGFSLICFSEKWCSPSSKEFNKLYDDSIIDFLKRNGTRLIILSREYPFLNLNSLDSIARDNIDKDFEIYYYGNQSDNHVKAIPCMWLIDCHNKIIYHSIGLQDDYSEIIENVKAAIKSQCPRCKGTGRVTPNKYGGPDEAVGLCGLCGGRG